MLLRLLGGDESVGLCMGMVMLYMGRAPGRSIVLHSGSAVNKLSKE